MNFVEMSYNLLIHPVHMSNKLKERPPVVESFLILLLVLAGIIAYIAGVSGVKNIKLYMGGMISIAGLAISVFAVFVFLIHLNLKIFGGVEKFANLFSVLLFIFISIFIYFRLPLLVMFSFMQFTPETVHFNMYFNLGFLVLFFIYSIVAISKLYELEAGKVFIAYILIIMYIFNFIVSYRVSLIWIRNNII